MPRKAVDLGYSSIQTLILDQACWYLNERSFHEDLNLKSYNNSDEPEFSRVWHGKSYSLFQVFTYLEIFFKNVSPEET